MKRIGDHATVEHVLGGERPSPEVHRVRIDMTVVADGGGDGGERVGLGAVDVHVAPRHQRELGRGEHAERRDELVRRARPRRGGSTLGVDAGTAGGDQHGGGEPIDDRARGLEHCRNAEGRHRSPHWPDAGLVHEVGTRDSDDTVDVANGEPRIGDRAEPRFEGD